MKKIEKQEISLEEYALLVNQNITQIIKIGNAEDNEYKYCIIIDKGCKLSLEGFYPGDDKKYASTEKCFESENGKCIVCSNN